MSRLYDHRSLDPLLQARLRLAAMTLLAVSDRVSFAHLKAQLAASDGNLGTHMKKLRDAGYVLEHKFFRDDKPTTEYRISERGRQALDRMLARLQAMVRGQS
jgi:DNA-binding transcriptional ArsR family regulator